MFQVDAFTGRLFGGNPAAVVVLPEWLADETLQAIAQENNLAETAFVVPGEDWFGLRWFTPAIEVDLCGHATLASAYVLFNHGYTSRSEVVFEYRGGRLTVAREGDLLAMNFPARPPEPIQCDAALVDALGAVPRELHQSRDLLAVFDTQADVESLRPDFPAIAQLDVFAVIASAPGKECDFVFAVLRSRRRHPGRPGDGIGALHAGSVLERAFRQEEAPRAPALPPWRRTVLREPRPSRKAVRARRGVPSRSDFRVTSPS